MADQAPARVELIDIQKRYGTIDVLNGVNLRIAPGEVIGLVGDNGAGKSTLMSILAGAVKPDAGRILVDGEELREPGPRAARAHGIEMVYQDLALCNDLDVASNLFLGREDYGRLTRKLHDADMRAKSSEHLSRLHIRVSDTRQEVGTLSGGQRQAVAIARAATFDPKVLVLDEPTAALAAREVEMVLQLIRDVSKRGVSVVLITHRLPDLFQVVDRIVVLYEGVIFREMRPADTDLSELVNAMMGK